MAYPFPTFGSFRFFRHEHAITESDTGWVDEPTLSRERPLGSSRDSIVMLAIGSATRRFECLLTPERFAALKALRNTTAEFVDWGKPTPDRRDAYLQNVREVERVASECYGDSVGQKIRVRVDLISQE